MVFVGVLVRRLGVLTQCNLVALANAVGVSNPTSRAYSQEFFKVIGPFL